MNEPLETMPFPENYPELLEQIGQVIFRSLRRYDVARESAIQMTFSIVEAVRTEIGGAQQYIPRGLSFELSKRDLEIWRKFSGGNYLKLAREYKLTEMQVRNIIRRARARETAARQGSLFTEQN
ncbi:MAG: transcriptional regulator [Candidatus Accumulibacter sp.]|nr:transcriptional regulator [Accumulibacter sp.]